MSVPQAPDQPSWSHQIAVDWYEEDVEGVEEDSVAFAAVASIIAPARSEAHPSEWHV